MKLIKWIVPLLIVVTLIVIYREFNPIESAYFPKCIFKSITGLSCPGCGSQRAIHHLLNFDIKSACSENILLVLAIPYMVIGTLYNFIKVSNTTLLKIKSTLFGTRAIYLVLLFIVAFTIIRNI